MRVIHSGVLLLVFFHCVPAYSQPSVAPAGETEAASGRRDAAVRGALPENRQAGNSSVALENAGRSLDVDTDGGVITNQAITVAGQDFYHYFVAAWRDKEGSERYTIGVRERPSARFGTEVWVEYRQRRVFRTYLPPARAAIRPISENAAEMAYQLIRETDFQNQLIRDADLGRDEF